MPKEPQFRFATDKEGKSWCIDDLNRDKNLYRKLSPWKCLWCENQMEARLGKIRTPHFAHSHIRDCSYESYVHKLAKSLLKEWFERNNFCFEMKFRQFKACKEKSSCKFYDNKICRDVIEETGWIRSNNWGYKICNEEETVWTNDGLFRADLILKRTEDEPIEDSLLIEICVNHPSTEKKKNSGLHIIELKFTTDIDVEAFCKGNIFKESDTVLFYGFDKRPPQEVLTDLCLERRQVRRVCYWNSGGAYSEHKALSCGQIHAPLFKQSDIELNYLEGTPYIKREAYAFLLEYGYALSARWEYGNYKYDPNLVIPVEEYKKLEPPVKKEKPVQVSIEHIKKHYVKPVIIKKPVVEHVPLPPVLKAQNFPEPSAEDGFSGMDVNVQKGDNALENYMDALALGFELFNGKYSGRDIKFLELTADKSCLVCVVPTSSEESPFGLWKIRYSPEKGFLRKYCSSGKYWEIIEYAKKIIG